MRDLDANEAMRLAALTAKNASVALLEITKTGLEKSIMDATATLRRLLQNENLHNYTEQSQGSAAKVVLPASILRDRSAEDTRASLYRPQTKQGDPRIWFYGLKHYADAGDILAIIPFEGRLNLINISRADVPNAASMPDGPIAALLDRINANSSKIANELLEKLRSLAAMGPTPSVLDARADTAIGRTLESALGISMNSQKSPDYKGIELKSFRKKSGGKQTRKNLFAQVADWEISKLKSSAEILAAFGYDRDGEFKLYCQVEARRRNSQGLALRVDTSKDIMWENSDRLDYGDFAGWPLETLRRRLLEKHAETFWVGADQIHRRGKEYFQFTDVLHTRKPIASQLDVLIEQGIVTMDHLIKRTPTGPAKEKGPIFKIEPNSLNLLFPPPEKYSLFQP